MSTKFYVGVAGTMAVVSFGMALVTIAVNGPGIWTDTRQLLTLLAYVSNFVTNVLLVMLGRTLMWAEHRWAEENSEP